jgi:hypothetical protein
MEYVLGRVKLMQCYMMGNQHTTIPHALQVPDGAAADFRLNSGTGGHFFDVNILM